MCWVVYVLNSVVACCCHRSFATTALTAAVVLLSVTYISVFSLNFTVLHLSFFIVLSSQLSIALLPKVGGCCELLWLQCLSLVVLRVRVSAISMHLIRKWLSALGCLSFQPNHNSKCQWWLSSSWSFLFFLYEAGFLRVLNNITKM